MQNLTVVINISERKKSPDAAVRDYIGILLHRMMKTRAKARVVSSASRPRRNNGTIVRHRASAISMYSSVVWKSSFSQYRTRGRGR
jgi:hypothetical protein